MAVSAELFIRTGGKAVQCPGSPRRTITVGGAKQHEHFRDLETGMHQAVTEAFERLGPDESLIGMGMNPYLGPGKGIPCRLMVTVLDLPTKDIEAIWLRVRALAPLICAVAASSPFESGSSNGVASNALMEHIRSSQKGRNPLLSVERRFSYGKVEAAKPIGLSRPPIALDTVNGVLLVSLWDVQECVRSNLATVALLTSLIRTEGIGQDTSEAECINALELAAKTGTADLKRDLISMLELAGKAASAEERMYLPIIRDRVENGSLGEVLPPLAGEMGLDRLLEHLTRSLRTNRPFLPPAKD